MANPNISLLGATYNGVTGVTLPKSGGGTATFPWVEGSQTITQNGTVDVTALAQVVVNVAGGGGSGLEYETGTYKPSSDVAQPTISFSNTHSTMPFFVMMWDGTGTNASTSYSNLSFIYADWSAFNGEGVPNAGQSNCRYGLVSYCYRANSTSSVSQTVTALTYPSSNTGSGSSAYPRYWVTSTNFKPGTASTSRYWKSGRTYKWYAVWK